MDNFRIRQDLAAVGSWNKNSEEDERNRRYFEEFVEVVLKALREDTFSHKGEFWTFPPDGFVNPHPHSVYLDYGQGTAPDMRVTEIGIAPRPLQHPHPPLYGGFTNSTRTARFWARYRGKPIVLSGDLDFCASLWSAYREEAARCGHEVKPGDEAGWGGIMICARTDDEAQALAEDMTWFWNGWSQQFDQGLPLLLVGSPDTVSRQIEAALARIPVKECFLLIPQGIHDRDQILGSLELFATKVVPRFAGR